MKKLITIIVLLAVLVIGYFVLQNYREENSLSQASDYKNAEYVIEGKKVKLVNGVSEVESVEGSASKTTTKYFGNEVKTDLNGDGREDVVFLLTQETGGSGTFFYAVAALNTEDGFIGSHGIFLGDRIAPQTTELKQNGVINVNYADRKLGEDFSIPPSEGKSIWLKLDVESMQFGEVVQNFEGEADPNMMNIYMKTWFWNKTVYKNGSELTPKNPAKFSLKFSNDNTFSASTDCNGIGGEFIVNGSRISFKNMISTLMFCEGSQETEFRYFLENAEGFKFTSKGEFIIVLKNSEGEVIFK